MGLISLSASYFLANKGRIWVIRQGKQVVFRLDLDSERLKMKAMRVLAACPGVQSVCLDLKAGKCALVGFGIDAISVACILRKKFGCVSLEEILSVGSARRNDTFPRTARITELQEQSENQQEGQTPPRQADSLISQIEALPVSRPLPSLSLPLASEAQPSSSPVSRPSQETSNQTQATADHAPELPFPFAPSSSRTFQTESLADSPAQSSICGGACLPKAKNLMEEKGLGGHDQLYDSAVRHLLSGIHGMAELKRLYDLHAGEQASQLREAAMLREQVEELEAKVSMANTMESCLRKMLSISEDRHAGTKRELALMQEKLDEANRRIEYLENERAEEKACRASVEREAMIAPRPSPVAPRSTSLSFVPSPSPRLTDLEGCLEGGVRLKHGNELENISNHKMLVMKVEVHDHRDKSKAMRAISRFGGIGSLTMDMEKKKLTVSGDFDPVKVVNKLKKSWRTEIVCVRSAKEDDGKKNDGRNEDLIKAYQAYYSPPLTYNYYMPPHEEPPNCVIC
ncbi:uncharacterized protein J3R85_020472 [Psidium guajava]|nr:uncharacterized protein J3R85_020472 [Psidium guajava]